ncbi:MAG TPA: carbamoyltransferase N-terminal domain-containing protein, partial [Candidatus Nanoarchaeia archaeon]|nr:carbamoyltransferase N-terminal domain-containing protein [Candidatus Nanoarchaeia archaeon]
MYVLGIACHYHDASATLLKDGCIVAAALEERFTRKKHDTAFPENAIRYCLQSQGISASDLTAVAFYEKPFLKFERVLFQHMQMFPWSLKTFVSAMPAWLSEKLRLMRTIRKVLKYHGEVFFVEHHLSHAASAFLLSPFRNATIVTVDGVGEWSTTTYGIGRDAEILLLKDIRFPHSLGLLYSTMTAYLGFSVNNAEYKVMGLSAYGNQDRQRNRYCALLRKVIDSKADGSYHLDLQYFTFHFKDRMPSEKLCALLGDQPRKPNSPITQRHKDIAAALQMVLEEVLTKILHHAYAQTKCPTLVMAGGVALNSVWNGKILQKTPFKRVWIQPDAGDGGSSMGAAA